MLDFAAKDLRRSRERPRAQGVIKHLVTLPKYETIRENSDTTHVLKDTTGEVGRSCAEKKEQ